MGCGFDVAFVAEKREINGLYQSETTRKGKTESKENEFLFLTTLI